VANIRVRHCTIQGFHDGINIDNTTAQIGHLIEDNRLLLNRVLGMNVIGPGTIIRRNTVMNTGGNSTSIVATGIRASGDVVDNVVDGIVAGSGAANFTSVGIGDIVANGILVQGNRVRNLTQTGSGTALGIDLGGGAIGGTVRDNYVVQGTPTVGTAITCFVEGRVRDNVARNYSAGLSTNCSDDGGNVVY
jgi:hypothetical protein